MSSPRTRWTLPQVSFLAIALLGMWGCCSVPCDPKGQLIVVREKETRDAYQLIVISKSKHQQIVWKLSHGSPYTKVAIKLGENIEPFVNCETTAGICSIPCSASLGRSTPSSSSRRPGVTTTTSRTAASHPPIPGSASIPRTG
jgi:hypothetical protein